MNPEKEDFAKGGYEKSGTIFRKVFYKGFRLSDFNAQSIVQSLHPFFQGEFLPGKNLQPVTIAGLADPPE